MPQHAQALYKGYSRPVVGCVSSIPLFEDGVHLLLSIWMEVILYQWIIDKYVAGRG